MNFQTIWQHFSDPEYVHVLINPLPVYGLAIALLALVLALFMRTQRLTIAALILVFICAISAWPTYYYGEAAYDRIKSMSDPAGEQWLDEHMARGMKMVWMFYVLAGVAAVGAAGIVKWPRASVGVMVATLAWGAATLGTGGYIAYAGGHVRHKEFRYEAPPPARAGGDHEGMSHMDHGTMPSPSVEGKGDTPTDHSSMAGMDAAKSPVPQAQSSTQEQLDASRMQLEESRLQLEASRKQLEATDAAKPGASPSPSATQSPHDDAHDHEHTP